MAPAPLAPEAEASASKYSRRWIRLPTSAAVPALAALALFGMGSLGAFQFEDGLPESVQVFHSRWTDYLAPEPETMNTEATRQIRVAVTILEGPEALTEASLANYRAHLEQARRVLTRSLRLYPAQARALAQLAAIGWELHPPERESDVDVYLRLIRRADAMAPTVPRVHEELGRLLLRMGRAGEALASLARAVAQDPSMAWVVVRELDAALVPLEQIQAALPESPEVMAALRPMVLAKAETAAERYLETIERHLPAWGENTRLVSAYADVCQRTGRQARLAATLERHEARWPEASQALALLLRAEARARLDDPWTATALLRRVEQNPNLGPYERERVGRLWLRLGEPERARRAFERALRDWSSARASSSPVLGSNTRNPETLDSTRSVRARLYYWIGQAQEAGGRPDLAYESYERALKLHPGHAPAARRVEAMRAAAGLVPDRPSPLLEGGSPAGPRGRRP